MGAEGATAFGDGTLSQYRGVISVSSAEGLLAVRFEDPARLECLVEALINDGFKMTVDEKFEDLAIVHGTHGLTLPCDWLGFRPLKDGGLVWLKADASHEPPMFPDVYDWDSVGWITERGHGFMLACDDDADVWLDFHSGRTIVSLKQSARARRTSSYR